MSSIDGCAFLILLSVLGATIAQSVTPGQCANSVSSRCLDDKTSFVQTRVVQIKQHDRSNGADFVKSNVTKYSSLVQDAEDPLTNEDLCRNYEPLPELTGGCELGEPPHRVGHNHQSAEVRCEILNVQPTQVVSYQMKWDKDSVPDCPGVPPKAHLKDQECIGNHEGPASRGDANDGWVVDRDQTRQNKPVGDREQGAPYWSTTTDHLGNEMEDDDWKCGSTYRFTDRMANGLPIMTGKWYFRAQVLGREKVTDNKWVFTTLFTSDVVEVNWGSLL